MFKNDIQRINTLVLKEKKQLDLINSVEFDEKHDNRKQKTLPNNKKTHNLRAFNKAV